MQKYVVGDTLSIGPMAVVRLSPLKTKDYRANPASIILLKAANRRFGCLSTRPVAVVSINSISHSDFRLLINILRSQGEGMSNNPYHRRDQLKERMHEASPKDICLVIRDLTHRFS